MTTTTSRTASRAPATESRSRLALVAAPSPTDARDARVEPGARALVVDPAGHGGTERRDWVRQVLGVTVTVHARGPAARGPEADGAARSLFAELSAVERLVGAGRPTSELSRLARGELSLAEANPVLRELHETCVAAHVRTEGAVDAWAGAAGADGRFAPGALVTTWALDRAARHLDGVPGVAFAVEAGGDLLLRGEHPPDDTTGPAASGPADAVPGRATRSSDGAGPALLDAEPWHVEIEHPRDRRLVLATLPVHDGGVATAVSGDADVVDLRSGIAEPTVVAATVVGSSLVWSDVWARAAVAHGTSAVEWVATLRGTRGLLVLADGTVHRWHTPG
ncbi:FAD:protein FMN transferase [Cellulomonas sp. 179-A 4D5 NHS]|uniref:FAD:protein FMN transferase n=1 Tax=Cellulomonas sp. 179-A 4D5 NHS TaxID=3142378 RepID=UPI00399FE649